MSRLNGVSLAAGLALLLVVGAVSAQQPGPPALYNRPNVGVGGAAAASALPEPGRRQQ